MKRATISPTLILLVGAILVARTEAFLVPSWGTATSLFPSWMPSPSSSLFRRQQVSSSRRSRSIILHAGDGIATNYTWHEEAYEIEVSVKVPKTTRAKDIQFKATSRSVDLRLLTGSGDGSSEPIILLDGKRPVRGRINLDGTYWVISDEESSSSSSNSNNNDHRIVTVTIEKLLKTPKDDFEVIDYDWKGVYPDDESEVSLRKYDEPESLDVREYAAGLGVDIDNINMSMVDKTMFSSGLNLTQSSLDQMTKAGLLQEEEVTQQADGTEYTVSSTDGSPQAYSPYGSAVHPDEMTTSAAASSSADRLQQKQRQEQQPAKPIPFLDTNSPWHQAIPVENVTTTTAIAEDGTPYKSIQRNMTRAAFAADAAQSGTMASTTTDPIGTAATTTTTTQKSKKRSDSNRKQEAVDPIDTLSKKKLQEILKSQGMPVSGNKDELQERLRQRVNSLLQGKQES